MQVVWRALLLSMRAEMETMGISIWLSMVEMSANRPSRS